MTAFSLPTIKISLLVLIVTVMIMVTNVKCDLGADAMSLMKIVTKLCTEPHDEKFAMQFYNCYNLLDQKEKCIFDKCQNKVFGFTLSTKSNIEASCKSPKALPVYAACLMKEFGACGLDFVSSVTTINICQGKLLGIE